MSAKAEQKANERLRAKRRAAGLDPITGEAPLAPRMGESLVEIMARGASYAVPPDKHPAPRSPRIAIPERFRGITLATLASLRHPETGEPSLGGVVGRSGVLFDEAAVEELRRRAAGASRVVLLGETHAGKSISAAALLHAAAAAGEERARFVRESDLRDPEVLTWARAAGFLVLDNLGWSLNGARGDSPLAAQYRAPACELIDHLSLRKLGSVRLVVTTWLDEEAMARAYSGGVVARVYEGAEVIRIVRPRGAP